MFKGLIGVGKGDIHEEIFHKPSDFQLALLTPPEDRKGKHLDSIFDSIKDFEFCRGLDEQNLLGICQNAEYRTVTQGNYVFQQGENVDCVVVVLSGEITVKIENKSGTVQKIGKIREGEHFGDTWLLLGQQNYKPSHSHYQASSACQLLVILEEHFEEFLRQNSFQSLKEKGKILSSTNCFASWSKADIHEVACGSRIKNFMKGETLVTQAAPCEYFCVLVKGVCSVLKFADGLAQVNRQIKDVEQQLKR